MDHLPTPARPLPPIVVPYLGGEAYDGRGFFGYETRCGWETQRYIQNGQECTRVVRLRSSEHDDSTTTSSNTSSEHVPSKQGQLLQTWLFFGVLNEVLNIPIERFEFTTPFDVEGRYKTRISTLNLIPHIRDWGARIAKLNSDQQRQDWERCLRCLDRAALLLQWATRETPTASILPDEVQLSIAVLLWTLNYYARIVYENNLVIIGAAAAASIRSPLLESRLTAQRWCPSLIEKLRTQLGPPGQYYAYLLGAQSRRSHKFCTRSSCEANMIDEENYETVHTTAGCACETIEVPNDRLTSILRNGQIPLIFISDDDDHLRIEAVSCADRTPYVAISHVWSDGLGNPQRNGLPICQSRLLRKRVNALCIEQGKEPARLIWMDTLCVPLSPKSSRNAAIVAMRETYESAEFVLVLDYELLTVEVPLEPEETLMRITCGSWMTRLWTLQEAALASCLVFQFSNNFVYATDLILSALRDPYRNAYSILSRGSIPIYNIRRINKPTSQAIRLSRLWSSLRWRSTTKERDMAICAAALLQADVRQVVEADDSKKMRALWTSLKEIPSSILWVDCTKIQDVGFRWAPTSLLNSQALSGSLSDDCPVAHPSAAGLQIEGLPAYRLSYTWTPHPETGGFFCFKPTSADATTLDHDEDHEGRIYKVFKPPGYGNKAWLDVSLHSRRNPALILQRPLTADAWVPGIIVDIYHTLNGEYRAIWLALVKVYEEDGYYDRIQGGRDLYLVRRMYTKEGQKAAYDEEKGELREAIGDAIDGAQRWCIS